MVGIYGKLYPMTWRSLSSWIVAIGGDPSDYKRAIRAFRKTGRVSYPTWHERHGQEVYARQEGPRGLIWVGEHSSEGAPRKRDQGEHSAACLDPIEAARVVVARADPTELARLVAERLDAEELSRVLSERGYVVRPPDDE